MPVAARTMAICVPSKARPDTFKKYTLKFLLHTNVPWFVFVEPQDYDDYAKFVSPLNLCVLKENNKGMSYVLNAIRDFCLLNGYKFCFKMDDDFYHWYNTPRVVSKSEQGHMLETINDITRDTDKTLGKSLLGGICFPHKLFHTNWKSFTHANVMLQASYVIRADAWTVLMDTFSSHEEFVASASLLEQGFVTLKCGLFTWDADFSTLPGGYQSYDRVELQYKDYDLLEKEYPHLTKYTRRRVYTQKTGVDFLVTDKTYFNKMNSVRLPISGSSKGKLSKETESWLEKLM